MKSPKRIIRVESEETHDYVRKAKDMDQVEAEEMSSVPSEISVPQKHLRRHSQCNEENFPHLAVFVGGDERRRGITHDHLVPAMLQQVSGRRREKCRQIGSGVSLLRKWRIVVEISWNFSVFQAA